MNQFVRSADRIRYRSVGYFFSLSLVSTTIPTNIRLEGARGRKMAPRKRPGTDVEGG